MRWDFISHLSNQFSKYKGTKQYKIEIIFYENHNFSSQLCFIYIFIIRSMVGMQRDEKRSSARLQVGLEILFVFFEVYSQIYNFYQLYYFISLDNKIFFWRGNHFPLINTNLFFFQMLLFIEIEFIKLISCGLIDYHSRQIV